MHWWELNLEIKHVIKELGIELMIKCGVELRIKYVIMVVEW